SASTSASESASTSASTSASESASTSASMIHSTSTSQSAQTNTTKTRKQLPNTGTTASATNALLGVVAGLTGLGLVAKRRKRDDEE
ncbi:LPXTG cell wall anchor domain-containing protein, partial [Streptococcus sp. 27098_8_91]